MCDTMDFVLVLRDASTSDPVAKLSEDALDQLQNLPNIPLIIDSPRICHSISTYLGPVQLPSLMGPTLPNLKPMLCVSIGLWPS
ncbi:hypothetical protein PAXRUDRAFT_153118 [Paxillus rubicundulus Ve08.2h10]|uniref:Uncharacterized protein n=1 Tax=Paxillus rubicundulus Ve08.2h10 TaxID=930991 RepID=A0A0D0CLD3_9AGAM|nr:hypothetical protein PAXRUDRAFT_153118 [Paxillus rubicundulus Ve08.2h10]